MWQELHKQRPICTGILETFEDGSNLTSTYDALILAYIAAQVD